MKKLLWLSLLLPVGLLAAFQVPNNIRLVSTNLYTIQSVKTFGTAADQETVRKAIIDYYHLKDVKAGTQIRIPLNDARNKAGWILWESAITSIISTKFINWKGDKRNLPQEALRMQKVLDKYAAR